MKLSLVISIKNKKQFSGLLHGWKDLKELTPREPLGSFTIPKPRSHQSTGSRKAEPRARGKGAGRRRLPHRVDRPAALWPPAPPAPEDAPAPRAPSGRGCPAPPGGCLGTGLGRSVATMPQVPELYSRRKRWDGQTASLPEVRAALADPDPEARADPPRRRLPARRSRGAPPPAAPPAAPGERHSGRRGKPRRGRCTRPRSELNSGSLPRYLEVLEIPPQHL